MDLSNLSSVKFKKSQKRVGRGIGSGKGGHTSGRGTKGQKGREKVRAHFEGGQLPFYKRIPKISGFKSLNSVLEVTTDQLDRFPDGSVLDKRLLTRSFAGKGDKYREVKIIKGRKGLEKKLFVKGVKVSQSVIDQIKGLSGTVS